MEISQVDSFSARAGEASQGQSTIEKTKPNYYLAAVPYVGVAQCVLRQFAITSLIESGNVSSVKKTGPAMAGLAGPLATALITYYLEAEFEP